MCRYGAHTDYTGFTILGPDPVVPGLQVQLLSGDWVDVPLVGNVAARCGTHPATTFIVNAGDLLPVWTNDRWVSAPHRVVNPAPELAHLSRTSLVFFTGPRNDAVVTPIPARYPPVTAGEHLRAKLERTNVD